MNVGLNCIDTPKLRIGDISETPIDIAINDDGPRKTAFIECPDYIGSSVCFWNSLRKVESLSVNKEL